MLNPNIDADPGRFNGNSVDAAPAATKTNEPVAIPAEGRLPKAPQIAIEFLKRLDDTGRHNLVSIHPETGVLDGCTFESAEWAAMAHWIEARDNKRNLYFSVNEPRAGAPHTKLAAHDIVAIRAICADVDPSEPSEGEDPVAHFRAERKQLGDLAGKLAEGACPPSIVLDSGGGLQAFWCLDERLDAKQWRTAAEAQGRGLARALGGDSVQDIPRIMRLPGTLNIPTPIKRSKGQIEARRASAIWREDRYTLDQIAARYAPVQDGSGAGAHKDGRTEPKSRQHIVFAEVMRRRAEWVGEIVPTGARTGTGEWRIPSRGDDYGHATLDRDLEEDLAIFRNGIYDYGTRRGHTPVSVICEFGGIDDTGVIAFCGCPEYKPAGGETFAVAGEPDHGVQRPTEQQAIAWLCRTLSGGTVEGDSIDALARAVGLSDQAMEAEVARYAAGIWFVDLDAPTNVAPILEPEQWQAAHIKANRARLPVMRALDPDRFDRLKIAWADNYFMPAEVEALIAEAVAEVRNAPLRRPEHAAPNEDVPIPLDWIDPRNWVGKAVPEREWDVVGWVPRHEVTLLYGDGGIGKTLVAHQLATAMATGKSWLGQETSRRRVMCFFCEDREEELHRRQIDINRALGVEMADLGGLRIVSRKYDDNLLALWDNNTGAMKRTAVWQRLRDDAVAFGADVVIVDTIADTYGGSEISRAQVNSFVKSCLGRLAKEIHGSAIALGHPSVSGKTTGSGTSGSTAWSNAVRSRMYLRYPKGGTETGNIRELEGMKLNYGPKGNLLKLRWQAGAFELVASRKPPSADAAAQVAAKAGVSIEDVARDAVLQALKVCSEHSMSMSPRSTNYAPKVLVRMAPELLEAVTMPEIENALRRLERDRAIVFGKIGVTENRKPVMGVVLQDIVSGRDALPANSSSPRQDATG